MLHPEASRSWSRLPAAGTVVHLDLLTGFGKCEPAPIRAEAVTADRPAAFGGTQPCFGARRGYKRSGNLVSPSCRANKPRLGDAREYPSHASLARPGRRCGSVPAGVRRARPGVRSQRSGDGATTSRLRPAGRTGGRLLIYPSVTVDGTYNNNVLATDNDEEDDYIFTFRPQAKGPFQLSAPQPRLDRGERHRIASITLMKTSRIMAPLLHRSAGHHAQQSPDRSGECRPRARLA